MSDARPSIALDTLRSRVARLRDGVTPGTSPAHYRLRWLALVDLVRSLPVSSSAEADAREALVASVIPAAHVHNALHEDAAIPADAIDGRQSCIHWRDGLAFFTRTAEEATAS